MARRSRGGMGNRGSVAIEYGIILPALLVLVLGMVDTGRLLWTWTTLDRAVEAASRCAAVNTVSCATATQVKDRAVAEAYGLQIQSSAFAVVAKTCGVEVSATYPFRLIIPWIARTQLNLSAKACYPV